MEETDSKVLDENENKTRKDILEDYNNNILIEALAGAGKTTILVNRLINQVQAIDDPSKIVAITFTEKAADELKARYQKELLKRYNEVNDEDKKKLENAIAKIDDMQISTIHSFCNKMVHEMNFEAGLGLSFEVVQDEDEEAANRMFFENFCRNDNQREDRERLANAGINAEQLYSTFKEMCHKRDVAEWVYDKNLATSDIELQKMFSNLKKYDILNSILECLREDKILNDKKKTCVAGFKDEEILKGGRECDKDDPVILDRAIDILNFTNKHKGGMDFEEIKFILNLEIKGGILKDICIGKNDTTKYYATNNIKRATASYKQVKEAGIVDSINSFKEEWSRYTHAICMELLVKAYNAYFKERKSTGLINNDDLLIVTRDMLKNSKTARDFFRQEYQYFYIDEYQDTDPVQTEILQLLTATEETIGKSLEETEFLDNRFCLIGDPKQSIYSFRGANVKLYSRMKAVISNEKRENCKLYTLNRNYRSNAEICSWVNNTYMQKPNNPFGFESCEVVEKNGKTQAGFDGMISAKSQGDEKNYIRGVYGYTVDGDKKNDIISNDAEHVASMIFNIISTKTKISVENPGNGQSDVRDVRPGDFMIITRKKDLLQVYAAALKQKGIPVLINGASAIKGDDEDGVKSNLVGYENLRILSNLVAETGLNERKYNLALALVKVFGIKISLTENFIYTDILFGNDFDKKVIGIDEKVRMILGQLRHYIDISKRFPLQTIEEMAQNYVAILRQKYPKADLKAEIGALELILEKIRASKYGSYKELNERLHDILNSKIEKELPLDEEENNNAVHLMNVHQAKGLEANIVILASPAYESPEFKDNVITVVEPAEDGQVIKGYVEVEADNIYNNKYSKNKQGKSEGFEEALNEPKKLHSEEELRILYVAGTRAKECLIISNNAKHKLWEPLYEKVSTIDESNTDTPEYQKMIKLGVAYKDDTFNPTKDIDLADVSALFNSKKEENQETIVSLCTANELLICPSDLEKRDSVAITDTQYMHGNLYGIMMHRFFELLISEEFTKKSTAFKTEDIEVYIKMAVLTGLESERLTHMQCKRLKLDDKVASMNRKDQFDSVMEVIKPEFEKLGEDILQDEEFQSDIMNATVVYTELPFEVILRDEEIASVRNNLKNYCQKGQKVRVSGTMDLLLEMKDKYVIWDYKSDVMKDNEALTDFQDRLKREYDSQLNLYIAAVKTMIADDYARRDYPIETKLYTRFRNM